MRSMIDPQSGNVLQACWTCREWAAPGAGIPDHPKLCRHCGRTDWYRMRELLAQARGERRAFRRSAIVRAAIGVVAIALLFAAIAALQFLD